MILKPTTKSVKLIVYYVGRISYYFSFLFLLPAFLALLFREWNPFFDFLIGFSFAFFLAKLFLRCGEKGSLKHKEALSVVSLLWVVTMFFAAIPLYLSGHYGSFLDACFEAMSGLATTGLTLVQDLDHMAYSTNFWRHFIMFIGGQGIVVAGILILSTAGGALYELYVGEGREERIFPNIVRTAKFIWAASFIYLLLGSSTLFISLKIAGMPALKAIFHSLCLFMAAFDTGGFTPHSQSILYYHNFFLEIVTLLLMLAGTINFGLHYTLWFGDRKEILRNIETKSFFLTVSLTWILVSLGLLLNRSYLNIISVYRKGLYHLISAHSGTGYMTVYPSQFATQWSEVALVGIILAMALGGGACSTAGGIKALRVGMFFKTLKLEIKKHLLPSSAVVVEKYHHIKKEILKGEVAQSAFFIILLYLLSYFFGGVVGSLLGYPFSYALFESVSATANVGLSVGITSPSMPSLLKIVYIFQMWIGRLEFISVLSLFGLIYALWRGK